MNIFDIVIPVGPKDIDIINKQLVYTKKNIIGYRKIFLITPPESTLSFIDGVTIVNEDIYPFKKQDVIQILGETDRIGWYYQQLLKLYASFIIPSILDTYLVIDSDTFFLKPTEFVRDGKYLYNTGGEYHLPYFNHMFKLHPSFIRMNHSLSGITHHMIFEKNIMIEMFSLVKKFHNRSFWKVFLENVVDVNDSGASEYEIYFNYLLKYHPDHITIRNLNWVNENKIPDGLVDVTDKDYVSIHWFCREDELPQRFTCISPPIFEKSFSRNDIIQGEKFHNLTDITVIPSACLEYVLKYQDYIRNYMLLDGEHEYIGKLTDDQVVKINKIVDSKRPPIIFCTFGHLVPTFFDNISSILNHDYILVSHNSDQNIDEIFTGYLKDEKLIHWYAQNVNIKHPKLSCLPIGIANSMWSHGDIEAFELYPISKDNLCFFQFGFTSNFEKRYVPFTVLKQKFKYQPIMTYREYIHDLKSFKYSICPEGNGFDTHRIWESLYVDTIPVVIRTPFIEQFERHNAPMVIIDDWEQLTPEFLEKQSYDELIDKLNMFKLHKFSYWQKIFQKTEISNLVIVHHGPTKPTYINDFLEQAIKVSPMTQIYVLIDIKVCGEDFIIKRHNVIIVDTESIPKSKLHEEFERKSTLCRNFRDGFWHNCSKRFVTMYDFGVERQLKNIFHMEYDNLLYCNLQYLLSMFNDISDYSKSAGIRDSENQGIPSFMFFRDENDLKSFAEFMVNGNYGDDMLLLGAYIKSGKMASLPLMSKKYAEKLNLLEYEYLYKNADKLGMVFDGRAVGQYIGGVDPRNIAGDTRGFINKDVPFDVSKINVKFSNDILPTVCEYYPICNLHIHCKDLDKYKI